MPKCMRKLSNNTIPNRTLFYFSIYAVHAVLHFCTLLLIVIAITFLFFKLPLLEDCKRNFRSSGQAGTCLSYIPNMVEVSHFLFYAKRQAGEL